ncbi:MAG: dTDP-4-dehydrorhamnose 3,5-epimerase family protein [Chiayiivirga sp.]|jgi:dTDP-4-dehydrorhamnose 3,5-epimerase|nr:dTDP-4-dehydrorhamnose 3,5-epimerase family protein [Chiayiivirga sp.]
MKRGVVDQIFASVLSAGAISAWHAHEFATDRISVVQGELRLALYDARPASPTRGMINVFHVSEWRPGLIVIPPQVWHGVQNAGTSPAILVNAVDRAYDYAAPDHWRVPPDSETVPYRFPQR